MLDETLLDGLSYGDECKIGAGEERILAYQKSGWSMGDLTTVY